MSFLAHTLRVFCEGPTPQYPAPGRRRAGTLGKQAPASVYSGSSLRDMVRRAGVIYAGTVDRSRVDHAAGYVVTRVHFSRVRYAKGGNGADTLTLSLFGGGGLGSDLVPSLSVGERYVIFAAADLGSPANRFVSVIDGDYGVYRVLADSALKRTLVLDRMGHPVMRASGRHLVILTVEPGPYDTTRARLRPLWDKGDTIPEPSSEFIPLCQDTGERMREPEFLAFLRWLAGGR